VSQPLSAGRQSAGEPEGTRAIGEHLPLVQRRCRPTAFLELLAAAAGTGPTGLPQAYAVPINTKPHDDRGASPERHIAVVLFCHVTVTHAGLSLPAPGSNCRKFSSIGLPSIHDASMQPSTCRPLRHSGQGTLQTSGQCGHRPSASGTPGIRGAHNSGCLGQQPVGSSMLERYLDRNNEVTQVNGNAAQK